MIHSLSKELRVSHELVRVDQLLKQIQIASLSDPMKDVQTFLVYIAKVEWDLQTWPPEYLLQQHYIIEVHCYLHG